VSLSEVTPEAPEQPIEERPTEVVEVTPERVVQVERPPEIIRRVSGVVRKGVTALAKTPPKNIFFFGLNLITGTIFVVVFAELIAHGGALLSTASSVVVPLAKLLVELIPLIVLIIVISVLGQVK